jgi:hypothetical protein
MTLIVLAAGVLVSSIAYAEIPARSTDRRSTHASDALTNNSGRPAERFRKPEPFAPARKLQDGRFRFRIQRVSIPSVRRHFSDSTRR